MVGADPGVGSGIDPPLRLGVGDRGSGSHRRRSTRHSMGFAAASRSIVHNSAGLTVPARRLARSSLSTGGWSGVRVSGL